MIKRNYFISVVKYYNDGSGSYTSRWASFYTRSFFANPHKALKEQKAYMKDKLKDVPGDGITVTAFNRI